MIRKLIHTIAAAALVAVPVAAQAVPARTSSPVAEKEQLSQALLAVLLAAGLALVVLIFSDNGDSPTSP